eukprot:jgi/Astpho2/1052/gw1.00017.23.1_t
MQTGLWSTQRHNEEKLNDAFKSASEVLLVFSVNGSGHFQGYARMTSPAHMSAPLMYNTYTATCSSTAYTIGCRVRPFNLGFQQTEHLHNPLNEGKPVKICRDGQELPPDLGAQL